MINDIVFRMKIEDVFFIRGRGTVVTGVISQGTLNEGESVTLIGDYPNKRTIVTAIEIYRKRTNSASAGDRVGIFLKDIDQSEISRGDVVENGPQNDGDIWWRPEDGD